MRPTRQVMLTPSVQHMYADLTIHLGNSKYMCVGIIDEEPVIRFHDLGVTNAAGEYYRCVDLTLGQWLELVDIAPKVLPIAAALGDHDYAGQDVNVNGAEGEPLIEGVESLAGLDKVNLHLGRNVHILLKPYSKYLHVRRMFLASEDCDDYSVPHEQFMLTHTKEGVVMYFEQWHTVLKYIPLVHHVLGIDTEQMFSCKQKHARGFNGDIRECIICNPNGHRHWESIRKAKEEEEKETAKTLTVQTVLAGEGSREDITEEEEIALAQGNKRRKKHHRL